MNLYDIAIRRPIFTTMLMVALVVFGVLGYQTLPVNLLPSMDIPIVTVITILPGASPEVVESEVIRYAFDLAVKTGRKKVTSATKSNGINFTMPFWDEVFAEVGKTYPDITRNQFHIDALCARFVTHPQDFDVVVGSNLFGDILTDLGPAIAGSIGVAPSANIDPTKEFPSMFEPVHGSAPDIAGKGIANPMGQIWCGAMMLDHLGFADGGELVMQALTDTLAAGMTTADIGGRSNTREVTEAVCTRIRMLAGTVAS